MATIEDVARVAGVSISTVSYALSGKRRISDDTRRRVEDAAAELHYAPRASARALAANRSEIIAVTAPLHADTDPTAHMAFAMEVTIAARTRDYDTLLLVQDDALSGMKRSANSALADGIIVLDVAAHDDRADARALDHVPHRLHRRSGRHRRPGVRRPRLRVRHPPVDRRAHRCGPRAHRAHRPTQRDARPRIQLPLARPARIRSLRGRARRRRRHREPAERRGFGRSRHPLRRAARHHRHRAQHGKPRGGLADRAPSPTAASPSPSDVSVIAAGMTPVLSRTPLPFDALPLDPALTCPVAVDILVGLIEGDRPTVGRHPRPTRLPVSWHRRSRGSAFQPGSLMSHPPASSRPSKFYRSASTSEQGIHKRPPGHYKEVGIP